MTPTLADLVLDHKAWLHTRAEQLTEALEHSGVNGGAHLREFCRAATEWRRAGASPGERATRWRWIESVVSRFLSSIGPEGIRRLAANLPTLSAQLDFLTALAEASIHGSLGLAVEFVAERLAAEVPTDGPTGDTSWPHRFCALLSLAGGTMSRADCLTAVINRAPLWLLIESLATMGTLEHYDNFYAELATALVMSSNAALPNAIARLLISNASVRLGEQISLIAQQSTNEPKAIEWLVAVEEALTRAGANIALRTRYAAYWTSWRDYAQSNSRLLSAYLNAVPDNHEDVFDFLTRQGSRQRGRVLPSWGIQGVTVTTAMSMRASRRERGPGEEPAPIHGLPSPDFDIGAILPSISHQAAILLVQKQRDPIFSLQYLALFVRHSQFPEIAARIASDVTCVARWASVQERAAFAVWSRLTDVSSCADVLQNTRDEVRKKLLPRLPTEALARISVFPGEQLAVELQQLVGQRLAAVRTLKELEHLVQAGSNHCFFTPNEMLALLDIPSLAADAERRGEERVYRVAILSRILDAYPWLGEPIIEAMSCNRLSELLASEPQFGPREHEAWPCDTSLALKARMIRRVAATDPQEALRLLSALRDRDIMMLFRARLDLLSSDEYGPRELSAAMQWLDIVDEVAPQLTLSYLGPLVASADVVRDRHERMTIEQTTDWVADWLGRHRRGADEELWRLLEQRIDCCATTGDLSGIARLAQVVLPGAIERLQAFRERAVVAIGTLPAQAFAGRDVQRLRAVLQKEAPHLLAKLPSSGG